MSCSSSSPSQSQSKSSDEGTPLPPTPLNTSTPKKPEDRKRSDHGQVHYLIKNRGMGNEHVTLVHYLNQPGKYAYSTMGPDAESAPLKDTHRQGLDRGLSVSANVISNSGFRLPHFYGPPQ